MTFKYTTSVERQTCVLSYLLCIPPVGLSDICNSTVKTELIFVLFWFWFFFLKHSFYLNMGSRSQTRVAQLQCQPPLIISPAPVTERITSLDQLALHPVFWSSNGITIHPVAQVPWLQTCHPPLSISSTSYLIKPTSPTCHTVTVSKLVCFCSGPTTGKGFNYCMHDRSQCTFKTHQVKVGS